MSRLIRPRLLAACVLCLVLAAALSPRASAGNLVEQLKGHGQFGIFAQALEQTRYGRLLASEGPYTIFAFTDRAFARLPQTFRDFLLSSGGRSTLEKVLAYHVIAGKATSADMFGRVYEVPTLDGYTLTIEGQMDFIRVNGSTVLTPDIPADNGVIHLLEYVIIPRGF